MLFPSLVNAQRLVQVDRVDTKTDKFFLVNYTNLSPNDFLSSGFITMAQAKNEKEATCFIVLSAFTPKKEYKFFLLKKSPNATVADIKAFIPKRYFHITRWDNRDRLELRFDPMFTSNGGDSTVSYTDWGKRKIKPF